MSDTPPTRHVLQSEAFDDPDLVDRIFDYVLELLPEIGERAEVLREAKEAVRQEFAGERVYVAGRKASEREQERQRLAQEILAQFNGRSATEVARRLRIGRATVYRRLKQAGRL